MPNFSFLMPTKWFSCQKKPFFSPDVSTLRHVKPNVYSLFTNLRLKLGPGVRSRGFAYRTTQHRSSWNGGFTIQRSPIFSGGRTGSVSTEIIVFFLTWSSLQIRIVSREFKQLNQGRQDQVWIVPGPAARGRTQAGYGTRLTCLQFAANSPRRFSWCFRLCFACGARTITVCPPRHRKGSPRQQVRTSLAGSYLDHYLLVPGGGFVR
jgi:hypothetical protein